MASLDVCVSDAVEIYEQYALVLCCFVLRVRQTEEYWNQRPSAAVNENKTRQVGGQS